MGTSRPPQVRHRRTSSRGRADRVGDADADRQVRARERRQTRPLRAARITQPFQEARSDLANAPRARRPGRRLAAMSAEEVGSANATNVAGSKVSINVTSLVQRTSDGDFDSRYTRVLLADVGGDAKESYREYYSSEDSTVSRRPTLTVVLGTGGAVTPPPPPPPRAGQHPQSDAVEHLARLRAGRQVEHRPRRGLGHRDKTPTHLVQRDHALLEQQSAADDRRQAARARTGQTWYLQMGPEVRGVERRRRMRHDPRSPSTRYRRLLC